MANDNFVLISGKSATGKSACLRDLTVPEGVMYLNCENNKKLPFRAAFMKGPDGKAGFTITDPLQVYEAFTAAETMPHIHTIVIDTLTYMMDMYESIHVLPSSNTMQAWGDYAQFWKNLMVQYVAKSTKNIIFLAHTSDVMNEKEMAMETIVKVKGSLMNQGIESYFGTVISTKKLPIKKLKDFDNANLVITEDEEIDKFKYVFQTKLTSDTVNERIRSPLGMWDRKETYIDNNVQIVLDRLHEYYGE